MGTLPETPNRSGGQLLILAFGPVQGFVAAARKTADLSLASRLLSELASASAIRLSSEPGVRVIVPSQPMAGVSNKIICVLDGSQAARVATVARQSASSRLNEIAEVALSRAPAVSVDQELFRRQLDRFLECYWAAVSLSDDFGAARDRAERALDERKALRDFTAYEGIGEREKASVDGFLESVIIQAARLRRQRGPGALKEGEQLDALGLVRRLWNPSRVTKAPSTAALAVAPWVRRVRASEEAKDPLVQVEKSRAALIDLIARRLKLGEGDDLEIFDAEYSWALEDSSVRERDLRDLADHGRLPEEITAALAAFEAAVRTLKRMPEVGRPSAYYAVITADGDSMGPAFSRLRTEEDHRKASEALATFATGVGALAKSDGIHLAYAGGDDVFALASLDDALPFIKDLHAAFASVGAAFGPLPPTLSVGLAIAHHGERLSESVQLARRAERTAKDVGGNRLGILLSKRSGDDLEAVLTFEDDPVDFLQEITTFLRGREMSRAFAHDLADEAPDLEHVPLDMARKEIRRILERKRGRDNRKIDLRLCDKLLARSGIAASTSGEDFVRACRTLSDLLRIGLHLAENTQAQTPPTTVQPAGGHV